jgi:hypothetical protein
MTDLVGFEFLVIMGAEYRRRLILPRLLADNMNVLLLREVKLCESSGGQPIWDLRMRLNEEGRMYLDEGWTEFTNPYELHVSHVLKFRYIGNNQSVVKDFDRSMCSRSYWPYFPADGAS